MKIKSISFPIAFGESFFYIFTAKKQKREKWKIERESRGNFSFPGTLKPFFLSLNEGKSNKLSFGFESFLGNYLAGSRG